MSEEISAVQHSDSIAISEAERELIPSEGYIVDHITGEKLVKDTPKEQVRQFIAKALEQEYDISLEDMQLSLWWAVEKIVVLSTSPFFIIRENILSSI
jgi:hypothetical protein